MAKRDQLGSVVRYLRSIDAKLGRLNKRLMAFLSAAKTPKGKRQRKTLWGYTQAEVKKLQRENPDHDVFRVLFAGTPEEHEALRKENPDAMVIRTGVPRGPSSFIRRAAKSRKRPARLKVVSND